MEDKEYFGSDVETINKRKWDWSTFKSTKRFPVSNKLLDWVIGQDHALEECYLCLDEWKYKLKYLQRRKWYKPWEDPLNVKPIAKQALTPGPYLLLLGDPGTGKSLMGRAMAEKLTQVYKKNKIKMFDIVAWANKILPSMPKISLHKSGEGMHTVKSITKKGKTKSFFKSLGWKLLCGTILGLGVLLLSIGIWNVFGVWLMNSVARESFYNDFFLWLNYSLKENYLFFMLGGSLGFSGAFLYFIPRMFGNMGNRSGIGGASSSKYPKLLVDNSQNIAPFIDATGHTSAQLYGSIAWDPYQTGGLGTPEHQRVTAGDVHRAGLGILYIDEIKNLGPIDAVTLLTVLEDGQLPITMRSHTLGADTSAMAVSTEPIPCMTFLIGAGNFDSVPNIHPALMDRITGYGKVVRMYNDMPNSLANRRKYIQFIAQEGKRFNMPPFSRDACIELVDEGRRRSGKRGALTTKFRPLISVIKTAGTLAQNAKSKLVTSEHIKEAIEEHCKTIQRQLLENYMERRNVYLEINPKGSALGSIYGLAVSSYSSSDDAIGVVSKILGQMIPVSSKKDKGYFKVTGVADKEAKWIQGSIAKVRSVILKKYKVDVAKKYYTHIDFSQTYGVDGPSAGVTMTILLCSLLEGKSIKQDVAVTGEINISSTNEILVTAVGGLNEKIKAAESWGFSKVCIPLKNYKHSIDPKDYKIKVIGCRTLDDYLKEVLDT